jgi:hypothetical protein
VCVCARACACVLNCLNGPFEISYIPTISAYCVVKLHQCLWVHNCQFLCHVDEKIMKEKTN